MLYVGVGVGPRKRDHMIAMIVLMVGGKNGSKTKHGRWGWIDEPEEGRGDGMRKG